MVECRQQRSKLNALPKSLARYPTLTMLERAGLATATTEDGKKVWTLTEADHAALAEHKERIDSINERLSAAGKSLRARAVRRR